MAVKDTWRRTLEYFGLVEGDYIDEGPGPDDTGGHLAVEEAPARSAPAPSEAPMRGARRSSSRSDDIDDIFGDDDLPPRRRGRRGPDRGAVADYEPGTGAGMEASDFSMHVVTPRSFNDAQQVADEFKRSKPVIINLQTADRELSKRLIDFASGLTYALGGGMQKISEGIFLLTPESVEVSAEEKARILEGGFFNQS